MLKFIGGVTMAVAVAVTGYLAAVAIRERQDVQRYLRIRSM